MIASTVLNFAILFCASSFNAVYCLDQSPLTSDVATPVTTADPIVVKQYKELFQSWPHSERLLHPSKLCARCNVDGICCPSGNRPTFGTPRSSSSFQPPSPIEQPTSISGTVMVTVTLTQSTPSPPDSTPWQPFALPTTLSNSSPTRTTLFRQSTSSTEPSVAAKVEADVEEAQPSESDKGHQVLTDITPSYYDYTIDGDHPFEVPLIVQDSAQNPITIFAFANISQELSFISHGLLNQIGRVTEITHKKGDLSPEELSRMLGFKTSSPGSISLNVLAGKNDKHFKSLEFVVFYPIDQAEGVLMGDLSVGLNFLIEANALQLTDEFVGVGAKEGLGIVLQRVYVEEDEQTAQQTGHDEL